VVEEAGMSSELRFANLAAERPIALT
jgi:hypothetical protein